VLRLGHSRPKKPSRVGASAPQASTRVEREDDWTEGRWQ
jgi:hypothetical protein